MMKTEKPIAETGIFVLLLGVVGALLLISGVFTAWTIVHRNLPPLGLLILMVANNQTLLTTIGIEKWLKPLFIAHLAGLTAGALAITYYFRLRKTTQARSAAALGTIIGLTALILNVPCACYYGWIIKNSPQIPDDPIGTVAIVIPAGNLPILRGINTTGLTDTSYTISGELPEYQHNRLTGSDFRVTVVSAEGRILWERSYPGESGRQAVGNRGSLLICMSPVDTFSPLRGVLLSPAGDSLTGHLWNVGAGARVNGLIATNDGGFLVRGCYQSSGVSETSLFFLKLDSLGDRQWLVFPPGIPGFCADSRTRTLLETMDGGFISLGVRRINKRGDRVELFKITRTGDLAWRSEPHRMPSGEGLSILEDRDGSLLMLTSTSRGGNEADGKGMLMTLLTVRSRLTKLTSSGKIMWTENLANSPMEHLFELIPWRNGNVLAIGWTMEGRPSDGIEPWEFWSTYRIVEIEPRGEIVRAFSGGEINARPLGVATSDADHIMMVCEAENDPAGSNTQLLFFSGN